MVDELSVAKKSLFVLMYNVTGGIVGYITMFFALRLVGQDAWGILGSSLAISGLLGILTDLGSETTHIKKLTKEKDVERCMGAFMIIKSFLGFIFLISAFLSFYLLGDVLGFKFESTYLMMATYLAIFGVLIGSFANVFKATYQARLHARRSVIPLFVQLFLQDTLIIFFSIWYRYNPYLSHEVIGVLFAYSYLIGQFGKLIVYSIWAIKDKISFKKPSFNMIRDYVTFSIPLALSGIVATVQAYTDRIMLQFFWNYVEVGGYFAVQKLALFITYLGGSVSFFLYPAQSHYHEKREKEMFHGITKKSERYLSLLATPPVFFSTIMASEILNLYRKSLVAYSTPLIILMFYAYLNTINRPYSSQMISAERPREIMKVGVIQATVNVILNAIFIPKSIIGVPLLGLKSTGAALATLISFMIGFLYLRFKSHKILSVRFEYRIFLHILAGFLSALPLITLKYLGFAFLSWYSLILSFFLFAGIYFLLLLAFKELTKDDLGFVKKIISF